MKINSWRKKIVLSTVKKAVILFSLFSSEAKNLTEGTGALTKDDLMASTVKAEDLAYPFIAEDSKDPSSASL
jgi:hypothetical protein